MSRLQEYLRTPNPVPRLIFTPKSCMQDQAHNLFAEQQGQQTKGPQQYSSFDRVNNTHEICDNLVISYSNLPVLAQSNIIIQKLDFGNDMNQQVQTPVQSNEKEMNIITTAQKKYDLRPAGNVTSMFQDGKQTERTLRSLAAEAYNIVCEKGSSTYRQVSESIINDSSGIPSVHVSIKQNKQQKNIKRRVYDALNVLIALGQLEKKGRKILPKRKLQKQKIKKDEIMELKRIMLQKQNIIKMKRKHLKNQIKKNQNAKKLFERNARSLAKRNQTQKKISMPFVLADYHNVITICEEKTEAKMLINKQKNNGGIYIDMETLEFIKFHNR